jgi:DNA-binding MarR family transcriptional regulator
MKTPFVMMNLLVGLYWFDDALQRSLRYKGLPPASRSQSLILMNLATGEHKPARLARNLGVTRQAISQLLAQMEVLELVIRKPDPTDRRGSLVDFSPNAASLRDEAQKSLLEIEVVLAANIGADRFDALQSVLAMNWGEPAVTENAPAPAKRRRRSAQLS